jgi:type IV pilus assembly protein PilA
MELLMKKLRQHAGFTLIELMIVVAIVGILAAIAIPSYMDYIAKAKASEVLAAGNTPKAAISEYWQVNNTMPTTAETGINFTNLAAGTYVASVVWDDSRVITVQGDNDVSDLTVTLTADPDAGGVINWTCTATAGTNLAPASCRN